MATPPRLLYVDDIPTPYRLGVLRLVAKRWPGAFKILFMAGDEPGRQWDLDLSGLDFEVLSGWQFRPPGQVNPFSFKWNPNILQMIRTFHPDVVALSGYIQPTVVGTALWCLKHGVPYGIACETSSRSTACTGWRWKARRFALSWIVKQMAFGLPVGREAAEYLGRFGPSRAPMWIFPNTPDTSAIIAESHRVRSKEVEAELRIRFGIEADALIILYAGRLIPAKRPMDVLDAYEGLGADYGKTTLVVVGDGPLMPALTARLNRKDVVFTGWLRDPTEMAGLMAIARMLVLPSEHEPWGAVVNEALAAGTPVIASDRVTAAVEMVQNGVSGFVYSVGDVVALRENMKYLLGASHTQITLMSDAARTAAKASSHEVAAANLIQGALDAIEQRYSKSRNQPEQTEHGKTQ